MDARHSPRWRILFTILDKSEFWALSADGPRRGLQNSWGFVVKRRVGWGLGAASLAAALVLAGSAGAAVTRYDITATMSGSLGGVAFTDQTVDFKFFGDPATLTEQSPFPGFTFKSIDPLVSTEADITGFAGAVLTETTRVGIADISGPNNTVFLAPSGGIGFDLFDLVLPVEYASFDFKGPLAPTHDMFGTGFTVDNVATSQGALSITSATNTTFSITPVAVPEPSTWALLLSGFLGVGAMLRSGARGRLSRARANGAAI